MSLDKENRIQLACLELEKAISNFDDTTEIDKKAKAEAEKIKAIKASLEEIKKQLDQLSK